MHRTKANAASGFRFADLAGSQWRLKDQMGSDIYDRDGNDLQSRGLFLDMSPWQTAVFSWTKES